MKVIKTIPFEHISKHNKINISLKYLYVNYKYIIIFSKNNI